MARALLGALALVACLGWATSGRAADGVTPRLDRDALDRTVRAILEEHGEVRAGLWVGGPSGDPRYALEPGATLPTASAIKTAFLVELFARFAEALDRPPPGLEAILADDHPAVAHFSPAQRAEVRRALSGASVRRIGAVMMGSAPASNVVYNAAANVATALLGGPEALTRSIRARDPAFSGFAVRRYMLVDRRARGDNEAPPEALAAVLRRLAARDVPGLGAATVADIRGAILSEQTPGRGRHFHKGGDLQSDPLTHVLSGWYEPPGREPVVYVVMLAQDTPGRLARDEAHRRLVATARRLADTLLPAALEADR